MITTTPVQNETFQHLLSDLRLESYEPSANVLALVVVESRFIKDLKINVGKAPESSVRFERRAWQAPTVRKASHRKAGPARACQIPSYGY
jgi:hypothetical protein